MRINVIGKHMNVTDAIRTYAEGKVSKLPKYFDLIQQIDVRIEEQPHKKGFHAEITVDVEHHDDFVANAQGPDLYACIDEATERAQRQLHDFKEKLKQGKRGGPSAAGSGGSGGGSGGGGGKPGA